MWLGRRAFFDAVRLSPFGGRLTQAEVDGQDVIPCTDLSPLSTRTLIPVFDRCWVFG